MSALRSLKTGLSDRQKVLAWLDKIGEKDKAIRDEVIASCEKNIDCRKYLLERYEAMECAQFGKVGV